MALVLSIGLKKNGLADRHTILREASFEVVSSGVHEPLEPLASATRFQVAIFGPLVPESNATRPPPAWFGLVLTSGSSCFTKTRFAKLNWPTLC